MFPLPFGGGGFLEVRRYICGLNLNTKKSDLALKLRCISPIDKVLFIKDDDKCELKLHRI